MACKNSSKLPVSHSGALLLTLHCLPLNTQNKRLILVVSLQSQTMSLSIDMNSEKNTSNLKKCFCFMFCDVLANVIEMAYCLIPETESIR